MQTTKLHWLVLMNRNLSRLLYRSYFTYNLLQTGCVVLISTFKMQQDLFNVNIKSTHPLFKWQNFRRNIVPVVPFWHTMKSTQMTALIHIICETKYYQLYHYFCTNAYGKKTQSYEYKYFHIQSDQDDA